MKVVTFGEIMLRLKTPENLRIMQSDGFEASYGECGKSLQESRGRLRNLFIG